MAKDQKSGSGATAVAEREKRVTDRSENGGQMQPTRSSGESGGAAGGIYKPGQGYYTRMWTAIGAGGLAVWLVMFIWQKLSLVGTGSTTLIVQVSVAVAVLGIIAFIGYRLLGKSPKVNDFLINTEGEMKKVNWTTRREIIGSTKVVIFVLVAMSVLLFVVDVTFMILFTATGVLKTRGLLDAIFGGGG
jgi:preprotein translocase SecE subunit